MPVILRLVAVVLTGAMLLTGCGSGGIDADTCDDIVDETMALLQRLIDDVDAEFGDLTIDDLVAGGQDLPSLERFEEDAARIDELATELGCSTAQVSGAVDARASELTADTDLGRFIVDAIRTGGL